MIIHPHDNTCSYSDFFRKKNLQTYVSTVKLHDNKRIYRQVFEQMEITFLYVDFSFYNKKFDEAAWTANIELKVLKISGEEEPSEVASNEITKEVNKDENCVTVTDNWGNATPGEYWKPGHYRWEAHINGLLVDSHEFYIQNFGVVSEGENPYFSIYGIKTFESVSTPDKPENRQYYNTFRFDATHFIFVELEIRNNLPKQVWQGEFFFNFYNGARQLTGTRCIRQTVATIHHNHSYTILASIGSDTEVTWQKDDYMVEIWFMDQKIAVVSFTVGNAEQRGNPKVFIPQKAEETINQEVAFNMDEDEMFADLNQMVGLEAIRKKLKDYVAFVKFKKLRAEKGIEEFGDLNLHAIFVGNPGTGKTTVARTLGKIYHQLGLLPKDTVFEADRALLVGKYIGETAPQTREVIEKARGGILLIDEAYSLIKIDDSRDYGKESLEIILKEMSDGPGDIAIIVAGYPKEMNEFLDFNPGLRSRFQTTYEFPDYVPEEMMDIAKIMATRKHLKISTDAFNDLNQLLTEAYRNRNRTFGNARLVGSIIEEAQLNLGVRIMNHPHPESLSADEISTITSIDLANISAKPLARVPDLSVNETLLVTTLDELNRLVGIHRVKQEVSDLIKLARYHKEIGKNILQSFSLHNVFTGNPGTGKTTVARLMAKLYKALGILERGHLVECSRENLVAGYVGQTAIKTNNMIDEAIGGVLFIDEAYALNGRNGQAGDFGHEAIEVILKRMEDERGRFAVIIAGYTKEIETFLDSNPGLRSRFDNVLHFDDYNAADLGTIARTMLANKGLKATDAAMKIINDYFAFHVANRDHFFGNARFVRKVIEKACRNQLLRMGSMLPAERTLEIMETITQEDVAEFESAHDLLQVKPRLGFSINHKPN